MGFPVGEPSIELERRKGKDDANLKRRCSERG
jgi:hypothetical protein